MIEDNSPFESSVAPTDDGVTPAEASSGDIISANRSTPNSFFFLAAYYNWSIHISVRTREVRGGSNRRVAK